MNTLLASAFVGFLLVCNEISYSVGAGESCEIAGMQIAAGQQKKDPKSCTVYKCVNQNNRIVLDTLTCAKQILKDRCRETRGPVDAPFPDCCPTTLCIGNQWN
uniref:SV_SVC-Cer-1 n=1 Tax=Cercophonius squama TaxID=1330404 RepID=T1DP97_9SCOR